MRLPYTTRAPSLVLVLLVSTFSCLRTWTPGTGNPSAVSGFTVDTTNRRDVLACYNTVWPASENYPADMAWSGNVSSGIAGTTSPAFKDDVRRRVNF